MVRARWPARRERRRFATETSQLDCDIGIEPFIPYNAPKRKMCFSYDWVKPNCPFRLCRTMTALVPAEFKVTSTPAIVEGNFCGPPKSIQGY